MHRFLIRVQGLHAVIVALDGCYRAKACLLKSYV